MAQDQLADSGQEISRPDFKEEGWTDGYVPGTVFTSFVRTGAEEDPNFGNNIDHVDETKYNKPYWYRLTFSIPDEYKNKRVWLNFKGTNRYATHYINGNELGKTGGHMKRTKYDITTYLNQAGENAIAVLIDVPKQRLTREGNGIFDIFFNTESPTYIPSASWDWMPYVPGLNTGITSDVFLSFSDDITFIDPWIRTHLPDNNNAQLSISSELQNSSDTEKLVTVEGTINPGNIRFSTQVTLSGKETKEITIDHTTFSQLNISNPNLWWPNGYGDPNLYTCDLTCSVENVVSDTRTISFGIRKYEYKTENKALQFYVNGQKILLRGGNWGMSEYLLRCRGKEYDTKVRLHQDMNFNMIRSWAGSITDDEFYDACDKYGIMVWDDFWLVFSFITQNPRDINEFMDNAIDKIKRLRNHPSIAVWCGANELTPTEEINTPLRNAVATYDGNDRRYQPCSNADEEFGLSGSGFWTNMKPKEYFQGGPANFSEGIIFGKNKGYSLRTEIGMATFTTFESFKEFMPEENWWPRNEMWNMHYFGPNAAAAGADNYEKTISDFYGEPSGIEEFCEKAQLLNIETMKAMFEAWNDNIWNDASGILIWMSQSAYPSFVWQTYDYYHDATGSYWGAKKACEPVHIQWNSSSNEIKVINTTLNDLKDLTATLQVYNLDGTEITLASRSATIDADANTATGCFSLSTVALNSADSDVVLLRLQLRDAAGKLLSENHYWRGRRTVSEYDYSALNTLPEAQLETSSVTYLSNGKYIVKATITNKESSEGIAFALRLRLINKRTGERILPVIMDDNYLMLLPGETRTICMEFDAELAGEDEFELLTKQFLKAESSSSIILGIPGDITSGNEYTLKVYPNPVTAKAYLSYPGEDKEFELFNTQGIRIASGIGREIDMSSHLAGLYYVRLIDDGIYKSTKLIKK